MVILFFLRRIGPYHHARFQSVADRIKLIVIETRPGSQEYAWQFNPQGSYTALQLPLGENLETGLRGNTLIQELESIFIKTRPEVVVTTGWADHEYHQVALIARKSSLPLLMISDSRWEDEPRKKWKEKLKKIVLKSYSAALVAGSASARYLVKLGFDQRYIFTAWDVVDNDYFSKTSREYAFEDRYFLCISRFIEKKNLFGLIDSFHSYSKNGGKRKLVIIGGGELKNQIIDRIKSYAIENEVLIHDFIQYDELPKRLEQALCLILPSFTDQWGLVVNEAMAASLPVIVSSNCGCCEDIVEHEKNGFVFNPKVTNELTDCLSKMDLKAERDWIEMGNYSKQIIDQWGLEKFANGLIDAATFAKEHNAKGYLMIHRILGR